MSVFPQFSLPKIQNVVSFANLDCEQGLDLRMISQKSQNSRYNPKRFPAVITRKIAPKSTVLIFKSGKLIIIGAKSREDARKSADMSAVDISKCLSQKYKVKEFRVTNIVADADIGCKIDIPGFCELSLCYKVNQFPGVIYKMKEPVKAVLVFHSGKVIFTGGKNQQDINSAFNLIQNILKQYQIKQTIDCK